MKNLMLNLNSHVKASRNPGSLQRLGRSVLLSDVPEKDNDDNKDNMRKIMVLERMKATRTMEIMKRRTNMSPGISFSARVIVFLPQSAREISATLYGT